MSLNPSKHLGDELLIHYQVYLRKANMLVDFAESMPFCRECGKEVQDDWVTCPHCSCSLIISSQNVSLQDTVVMGNINSTTVNDSKTKCASCGSVGVTQIACSVCKKMSHCNICETEVHEERRTERICKSCHNIIMENRGKTALDDWLHNQRISEESAVKKAERRREIVISNLERDIEQFDLYYPIILIIISLFVIRGVYTDNLFLSGFCSLFYWLVIPIYYSQRNDAAKKLKELELKQQLKELQENAAKSIL